MLMPSIFGENLFDDFFNNFPFYDYDKEMKNTEKKLYGSKASHVMKNDIKEMDNYERGGSCYSGKWLSDHQCGERPR